MGADSPGNTATVGILIGPELSGGGATNSPGVPGVAELEEPVSVGGGTDSDPGLPFPGASVLVPASVVGPFPRLSGLGWPTEPGGTGGGISGLGGTTTPGGPGT